MLYWLGLLSVCFVFMQNFVQSHNRPKYLQQAIVLWYLISFYTCWRSPHYLYALTKKTTALSKLNLQIYLFILMLLFSSLHLHSVWTTVQFIFNFWARRNRHRLQSAAIYEMLLFYPWLTATINIKLHPTSVSWGSNPSEWIVPHLLFNLVWEQQYIHPTIRTAV